MECQVALKLSVVMEIAGTISKLDLLDLTTRPGLTAWVGLKS